MSEKNEIVLPLEKTRKRFVRSLEYELIASLALQQFVREGLPDFEKLLATPLTERIPALMKEYGLKRMHKLVKTLVQEFCYSLPMPKSRKLTDTRISVVACDLILAAHEDQLSMEDLIVFLELAKSGLYGKFKGVLTHYGLMQQLEQYRQKRYEAFVRLKELRDAELKAIGPVDKLAPEPITVKELFEREGARIVPFRKIS
jgi:hypothetical protein